MSTIDAITSAAESVLVTHARLFATRHHGAIGQTRKYTGEPYIVHPAAVATIVRSVAHTEVMVAAAWLHDTVEDTNATIEDVRREFGDEVAALVEMLTDVSRPEDGNRAARKAKDRAHTAQASAEAQTIRLADLIHNSEAILQHDLNFAAVYLPEKAALLQVLTKGNVELHQRASDLVRAGLEQLHRREGAIARPRI